MICVRHSPESSTPGDSIFFAINWKGCQKKKKLTHHFNTLGSFISPKTHVLMSEEEASQLLMGKNLQGWRDMVEAASVYLEAKNIPWFSLQELQN